jgi:hypothetical protein
MMKLARSERILTKAHSMQPTTILEIFIKKYQQKIYNLSLRDIALEKWRKKI